MPQLLHRSPGFTAIFNAVKGESKNGILDLGEALGTNLTFYLQLGCHFQFENFNQIVSSYIQNSLSEEDLLDKFLEGLNSQKKYNVVLFWDLLNYLPTHLIGSIVDKLQPVLAPNALVHMINFVGSTVPARPSTYTVNDQYQLNVDCVDKRREPLQRVTTLQLLKLLPNFLMLQSYLNNEGMAPGFSEQILRFGTAGLEEGAVFSSAESQNASLKIEERISSPAIERFIAHLDNEKSLLDLGLKRNFNHDFWKRQYKSVTATDLLPILTRYLKAPKDERANYLKKGRFLDFNSDRIFDVIIAWDIFNYCSTELLAEIGRRMVKYCRDGTHLVVMTYSAKAMPAVPQPFVVSSEGVGFTKKVADRKLRENKTPLTSSKILKYFPGFYVEHSYSFLPGMQQGLNEYLFVFKGHERLAKEKQIMAEEVMARRKAKTSEST